MTEQQRHANDRAAEYFDRARVCARASVEWQCIANGKLESERAVYALLAETQSDIATAYSNAARKFAALASAPPVEVTL
jgi:hypothetical protein